MINEQLETALASDGRVKLSGFVPGNTPKQRDQARRLNISLYDAKPSYSGFDTNEGLSYPPDELKIDLLIMHSYGRDVGKQAQIIKEAKGCKLVLVVHIIRTELEKDLEMVPPRSAEFRESAHELQLDLCKKADLVLAVGPQVAKAYKDALKLGENQDKIITLMPSIPKKFFDTKKHVRSSPFKVLLSASTEYFKVKGCDIAAKAFKELKDPSIQLLLVVKELNDTVALGEDMVKEGISPQQLEVRKFFGGDQAWQDLLSEVDLLIKPSKSEGFGMSGLRAIAADLPVLISGNCGLSIALEKLPSGNKHVVDSQDPQVWAKRIKEIKEKDEETCRSEAEQLKNEYSAAYNWEDQFNSLIDKFSTMVEPGTQYSVEETLHEN